MLSLTMAMLLRLRLVACCGMLIFVAIFCHKIAEHLRSVEHITVDILYALLG